MGTGHEPGPTPVTVLVEFADLHEQLVLGRVEVGAELGDLVRQGLAALVETRVRFVQCGDGAHVSALELMITKYLQSKCKRMIFRIKVWNFGDSSRNGEIRGQ